LVSGGYQLVISDLVELECRVLPLKGKDPVQLWAIESFCSQPGIEQLGLDRETFLLAADILARHSFKLGDSLHLAASVRNGCSLFLTNDKRLSSFTDIQVEALVPSARPLQSLKRMTLRVARMRSRRIRFRSPSFNTKWTGRPIRPTNQQGGFIQ